MIIISPHNSWLCTQEGNDPLAEFCTLTGAKRLRALPLTTRALLWVDTAPHHRPNPLASALVTLLQQPPTPIFGPAAVTGTPTPITPAPLTDIQTTALTAALRTLQSSPRFTHAHTQAARITKAWAEPTTTR